MSAWNLDEARQFLRDNHRAILSTFRADGRPQLSPVAVGVDDAGRAVVSSRETAFKVKNLRRDPRASVCVVADDVVRPVAPGSTAPPRIVSLPEAMEPLVDYYRRPGRGAPRLGRLPCRDGAGATGHDPDRARTGGPRPAGITAGVALNGYATAVTDERPRNLRPCSRRRRTPPS